MKNCATCGRVAFGRLHSCPGPSRDERREELTRHAHALAAAAWDEGYWAGQSAAQGTYGDGVEAPFNPYREKP